MTLVPFRLGAAVLAAALAVLAAALPSAAQPASVADVLNSVVGVRAQVPEDARTANSLGTTREGSGIVIGADGLVLTIGYLILEATSTEIVGADGHAVPADIVGYDHNTGFGLLRAGEPLDLKPVEFGDSSALSQGDIVLAVSFGGNRPVVATRVVSRRPFAGYWEYLLESAIFTSPPHFQYGGAALIGEDGRLLGIGSLMVNDAVQEPAPVPGNMFVPIDTLKPILQELVDNARPSKASHPWLGLYTDEAEGRVFVTRTAANGPAEKAGIKAGDIVIGVGGKRVSGMADFFRKVWAVGDAGVEVPIDVLPRNTEDFTIERVMIRSRDRYHWLKLK
jgi:S1-C subfamily serine protease